MSNAREAVYQLVKQGVPDEEIVRCVGGYPQNVRQLIWISKNRVFEEKGGPVRRAGPWPIAYVRPDGQRMFLVGAGHVIGERSLAAFGFRGSP